MTLEELQELRAKAANTTGKHTEITLSNDGRWVLWHAMQMAKSGLSIEAMACELRKLATPPAPLTIEITVPFSWAMDRALMGSSMNTASGDLVNNSCRAVLKPWL